MKYNIGFFYPCNLLYKFVSETLYVITALKMKTFYLICYIH